MKPFKPKILTANDLRTGDVIFRVRGGWTNDCAEATIARTAEQATVLLAEGEEDAARNTVVDPYLLEVFIDEEGGARPVRYRESIRALGPSVAYGQDFRAPHEARSAAQPSGASHVSL